MPSTDDGSTEIPKPVYDGTQSGLAVHLELLYRWLRAQNPSYHTLVTKGFALSRNKTTVSNTETAKAIAAKTYATDGTWEAPKSRSNPTDTALPDELKDRFAVGPDFLDDLDHRLLTDIISERVWSQ